MKETEARGEWAVAKQEVTRIVVVKLRTVIATPDTPPLTRQATVAVPLTPSAVKWLAVLSRAPGGS